MHHDQTLTTAQPPQRLTRRAALRDVSILGVATWLGTRQMTPARAQEATPDAQDASGYPELAITAADFSFVMPASIPGGFTKLTMTNDGHADHHAMFMRLNDGTDMAELEAALSQPDPGPIFALSQSIGGPVVGPGETGSVIAELVSGQYMVICIVPEADGTPHYMLGMYAPLEVTEPASDTTAPEAVMTVEMVDFAYEMHPMEVAAGPQIWNVPNVGEQIHEMVVLRLELGITYDQVKAMLGISESTPVAGAEASPEAMAGPPPGPPPFVAIGGVAPMFPGYTNWAEFDFAPGEYVAICFVPDPETSAPHFVLGMIMPFTVA